MSIVFITREGFQQPGARVRCYGFAEEFKKNGLCAEVFSFVDDLGAKAGKDEKGFGPGQRLKFAAKSLGPLLSKKDSIFVISRFNYHSIPSWLASAVRNNPYVFDMDDWEAREELGNHLGFIPRSKAEFLTRRLASNSAFCIAASHYLKDYLSQHSKKVYYIPTGVDLDIFRPAPLVKDNREVIFSWHGLINRRETLNDLEFMIDCFIAVNNKHPLTELWIKGSGMFMDGFISLLKKYNNSNIKYIEWSHPETIASYLGKVDIGLFPVLEKSRFNLAKSPTKVFEYMAMKAPVVGSKIGEVEHIIDHGKNGFLAENKEEFIAFMEALIKAPDLRYRLGENARISIEENYSLDLLGERLYKIFSDHLDLN